MQSRETITASTPTDQAVAHDRDRQPPSITEMDDQTKVGGSVGARSFVSPQRGFSLSLFCTYSYQIGGSGWQVTFSTRQGW